MPMQCERCKAWYGEKIGPCACFAADRGPVHPRWSDPGYWEHVAELKRLADVTTGRRRDHRAKQKGGE